MAEKWFELLICCKVMGNHNQKIMFLWLFQSYKSSKQGRGRHGGLTQLVWHYSIFSVVVQKKLVQCVISLVMTCDWRWTVGTGDDRLMKDSGWPASCSEGPWKCEHKFQNRRESGTAIIITASLSVPCLCIPGEHSCLSLILNSCLKVGAILSK